MDIYGILSEIPFDGQLSRDYPMSRCTSFRIGGNARVFLDAASGRDVAAALDTARAQDIPFFVMGNGTNLLVRDEGFDGLVIRLGQRFSSIEADGASLTAQAGALLPQVAMAALTHGLTGLEFASGIPGSAGGMNAGAYGGEIGPLVEEVHLLSRAGGVVLRREEMRFSYRRSVLSDYPLVVTGAKLRLRRVPAEQTAREVAELAEQRCSRQPLEYPSAGSTFKRPVGCFAGALIDQAGMRGVSVGGAQVSEKHAGFVVNKGGATPGDVLELIALVQRRVFECSGVMLESEIKIIGEA